MTTGPARLGEDTVARALRYGDVLAEQFADSLAAVLGTAACADSGAEIPEAREVLDSACRDRTVLASFCRALADQAQRFRAAVHHLEDDWIDRSELTPDWIARHIDRTGHLSDAHVLGLADQLDRISGYLANLAEVRPPHQVAAREAAADARDSARQPNACFPPTSG